MVRMKDEYRWTLVKGFDNQHEVVDVSVTFLFDPRVFHSVARYNKFGLQLIAAYQLKVSQTVWNSSWKFRLKSKVTSFQLIQTVLDNSQIPIKLTLQCVTFIGHRDMDGMF